MAILPPKERLFYPYRINHALLRRQVLEASYHDLASYDFIVE